MTTEHTPGPWQVIIDDDGNPLSGRPSVFAADEYDCSIVHWDGFVQEYFRSARGDKEIHANARLIAAAPELLEALEMLLAEARERGGGVSNGERLGCTAIAKAKGAT